MITVGLSDLSFAKSIFANNARVKSDLQIASKELSTGKKNDLITATGGDLGKLFSIERTIGRLVVESDAIRLAGAKASLSQMSLERIHDNLIDIGPELLSAIERGDVQSSRQIALDARNGLDAVVTALNVSYGRHKIFSGAALNELAIASSGDIITDISAIIAGSVDSRTALVAIDTYFFDAGAGFDTNIYRGSELAAPPLRTEGGPLIEYSQKANSIGIRKAIRALAIAAVAADAPNFVGSINQVELLREAGNAAINATGAIIEIREQLGFTEGRIDQLRARNQAMTHMFELERASITAVDPFETATKFEALEGRLQTIYTITARLSNLSLTNFLR